jgi:hypothetical protein
VATRAELVQAFDYLALLKLGPAARSWNHRAVARRWADRCAACTADAARLADLYERARYTTGADALPVADRDAARGALRSLVEALPG